MSAIDALPEDPSHCMEVLKWVILRYWIWHFGQFSVHKILIFYIQWCAYYTVPIAEILSGKNVRAWVSMVLYLKKKLKLKYLNEKKNPGSPVEVTC